MDTPAKSMFERSTTLSDSLAAVPMAEFTKLSAGMARKVNLRLRS